MSRVHAFGKWLLFTANEQFFNYIMARISYFGWDDDVHFVLDQHI
jgi:hypothetical protein